MASHDRKKETRSNQEVEKDLQKINQYEKIKEEMIKRRSTKIYDKESLELSEKLVLINPDLYFVWNFRKEIILFLEKNPNEDLEEIYQKELLLIQKCLIKHPKSYFTWFQRKWITVRMNNCNWPHELILCKKFLAVDERNFHCWNYRRFVVEKGKQSLQDEWEFTTEKIEQNFSNYSAWHNRTKLLNKINKLDDSKTDEKLTPFNFRNELDFVTQAFYTDPDDQSGWIYHRWLTHINNSLEVINHEIEMCEDLLSLEPESKWTLFTLVLLLLQKIKNYEKKKQSFQRILEILLKLKIIDPIHYQYYQDLSSEILTDYFLFEKENQKENEKEIQIIPSLTDPNIQFTINLSKLNLSIQNVEFSRIIFRTNFFSIKNLDLSNNKITSLSGLQQFQSIEQVNLDNNQIQIIPIIILAKLPNLINFSCRNNLVNSFDEGYDGDFLDQNETEKKTNKNQKLNLKLQVLNLKENPIKETKEYQDLIIQFFPNLILLDEEEKK
ncbi:geranylgeranyl transferase type-2 subunit alpha [Anaeramoeba ignava]|uniref:Geranylgeranyl transferase type-2 subunit alpha n=1 Tax=Anaeramoeba ignava TaxID=1746090 RepID=A0A9Q0LTL1_ANAIG|nr:geranylgeranyl transferase type-2 subunit alpha [Anaeramoeba ignava]